MKYKRNSKSVTIIPAILSGIACVGLLYPVTLTPIRYTEGYGPDMNMVGRDMWRAEENYRHGTQKEYTASSTA